MASTAPAVSCAMSVFSGRDRLGWLCGPETPCQKRAAKTRGEADRCQRGKPDDKNLILSYRPDDQIDGWKDTERHRNARPRGGGSERDRLSPLTTVFASKVPYRTALSKYVCVKSVNVK
eukprot:scaffold58652_cov57-Phaeocystis_antarctica.AAC.1